MFDRLMEMALATQVKRIKGVFRPTQKNSLVAGLYEKLGFRKTSETAEEIIYTIDVPASLKATTSHIKNIGVSHLERESMKQAALI